MIEIISSSPDDTFNAGKRISSRLKPGSVAAISGTLGSGKTCFVNGIASGLGITENLTSPTYTIINEYQLPRANNASSGEAAAKNILYHIDAYRLRDEKDFEDIGGLEIIDSQGIIIIEWSEKIQKIINKNAVAVSFTITGSYTRLIKISGINLNGERR